MNKGRTISIDVHTLRQLMVAGELMAVTLDGYADDLNEACGVNEKRLERALPKAWQRVAVKVKRTIQGRCC